MRAIKALAVMAALAVTVAFGATNVAAADETIQTTTTTSASVKFEQGGFYTQSNITWCRNC